ncbi:hypothetical protein AWH48_11580 [Domibacillus aminovorans]|uniref:LysM domain-containing protein n=1 Tax=Domibacillus aminovorans TaxID=29332 RepID=A0A177KKJ5_9BACI|nr:LysM domain-containing protein [Domibacillus aminovorans]OAH53902.1 hypothetical protein AWH48_11580 [Domibacillus aminovorans]
MARLGKVELRIETEGDSHSIDATTNPVEKGNPMTDHILTKPHDYSLSGEILGPDYQRDKEYLISEMEKGTVFTYIGRNVVKDVLIMDIQGSVHSNIANGSEISIKLQTVKFAATPWTKVKNTGEKKPVDTKPAGTKVVYHVVKAGDTYSALAKKYNTTVKQLQEWNKYPPTKIPIGVKLHVGDTTSIGQGANSFSTKGGS